MDKELLKGLQEEIEELMYKNPKCDFEHIWNCALDKATDCFTGYGDN